MSDFIIRKATAEDIGQMLVNGEAFLKEIGKNSVPFDRESMRIMIEDCIACALCFIAVDESGLHLGGVGAEVAPMPVNRRISLSVERFLWIVPGDRGKGVGSMLVSRLRDAASNASCNILIMVAMVNDTLPQVEDFYFEAGLAPLERTYFMRL